MKLAAMALPFQAPKGAGFCYRPAVRFWLLVTLVVACSVFAPAQMPTSQSDTQASASTPQTQPAFVSPGPVDLKSLPKNLVLDQKVFWTAPLHMSKKQW